MIIYKNTKSGFIDDVRGGMIAEIIEDNFQQNGLNHNNDSEFNSWHNSLQYVGNVLDDKDIADDCPVAIEYQIPLTSKRVDFLIAGKDIENNKNIVVIELKQWNNCTPTEHPDVVKTILHQQLRSVCHPSYQAYSYAKIIENFNEDVQKNNINLIPCAYLHNFKESNRENIENDIYKEAISLAPCFLSHDALKLRNFIKTYIRKKDDIDLLMKIEYGKLKPAKALQDALASMLHGNQEFYLIDEQKVAFETVKKLVEKSLRVSNKVDNLNQKFTIIIEGGPGTGKSVVAIQLLCELIKKGYSANYVTKNEAPRNVYFSKLRQDKYKRNYIKNLFRGSGCFIDLPNNYFDCLIVDEAHRLNAKSGMIHNKGENQIKEIIHASRVSVFFIDESQVVTTKDIGSVELIKKFAEEENSVIFAGEDLNLVSQFRCNGSNSYLNFLDSFIEKGIENKCFDIDYDIKLYDNPCKLRDDLRIKNSINNKARMVAGYCYDWVAKHTTDPDIYDIILEDNFKARWNFYEPESTWAINEDSFEQVGCIHTSQGLEFDYVGVIIGLDMRYEDGHLITDYTCRSKNDSSISGIKKNHDFILADKIIRNTYRTLLSRGQKGCYIYCQDKKLLHKLSELLGIDIIK